MNVGFTEDDQARIADEVQARVRSKRVGLGFGGESAPANVENPPPPQGSSSSLSSAWFHEARNATQFEGAEPADTTKGVFPWDGGRCDKTGESRRKVDLRGERSAPRAAEESTMPGRPQEREFPMVRDRDIDNSMAGRDTHSRRRSEERERDLVRRRRRGRSRSRDRQMELRRESWERERERDRERKRDRGVGRDRDKDRFSGDRRSRSRDRDSINRSRDRRHDREHGCNSSRKNDDPRSPTDRAPANAAAGNAGKQTSSLPSAKQAKATLKRRLKEAVAGDATLKMGFKASLGGGGGWERSEMAEAADFFKSDEVAAKGGIASVAPEYEARMAEIRAVEDEDIMCLGDGVRKRSAAVMQGMGGSARIDPATQKHHEAIFSPTGSSLSHNDSAAVSTQILAPQQTGPDANTNTARVGSAGVVGAAARARLALTGKGGELPKITTHARVTTRPRSEERSCAREDEEGQPLFKTLRAGELVEARYTSDDKWYSAVICQVIHSGFEIARYKVRYPEYGNEETISWTRIKRLEPAQVAPTPLAPKVAPAPATVPSSAPCPSSTDVEPREMSPLGFAGLRPRSLGVEHSEPQSRLPAEQSKQMLTDEAVADVVINPSLLPSNKPGRKLSWKEKLQARTVAVGSGANSARTIAKKQISLVPDYAAAAQRRERQVDQSLDKSEWRSKVVFGMGGSKAGDRT